MQKEFFRMLGYSDKKASELSCKLDEQLSNDIKFYRDIGCSLIQSEYLAKNVFNIVDTYKAPASLSVPTGFTESNVEVANIIEDEADFGVCTDYITDDPFTVKGNSTSEEKIDHSEFTEVINKPVVNMVCEPIGSGYNILKEMILNERTGSINSLSDKTLESDVINYLDYAIDKPLVKDTFRVVDKDYIFVGVKAERENIIDPINIILLVDTSMNMQDKAVTLQKCIIGIASKLKTRDKLSIISYWDENKVVVDEITRDNISDVILALSNIEIRGESDGYAGLISAFDLAKKKSNHSEIIVITEDRQDMNIALNEIRNTVCEETIASDSNVTFIDVGDSTNSDGILKTLSIDGKGQYFKILNDLDIKNMIKNLKLGCNMQTDDIRIQIEFNPTVVSKYKLLGDSKTQQCKFIRNDIEDKRYLVSVALYEIEFVKDTVESNIEYQAINKDCKDICEVTFSYIDVFKSEVKKKTAIRESDKDNEHNNLLKSVLALKLVEIAKSESKEQLYREFCKVYGSLSTTDDKVEELVRLVEILLRK